MTSSLCVNMGDEDDKTGVACYDLNLGSISDIKTSLTENQNSYYFILDCNDNFIYHSQRGLISQRVSITQAEFS